MSGDLLYASVFLLMAALVIVPAVLLLLLPRRLSRRSRPAPPSGVHHVH